MLVVGGLWTVVVFFFFFQAEDGIRDLTVTGVQTCALPISSDERTGRRDARPHRRLPLHRDIETARQHVVAFSPLTPDRRARGSRCSLFRGEQRRPRAVDADGAAPPKKGRPTGWLRF